MPTNPLDLRQIIAQKVVLTQFPAEIIINICSFNAYRGYDPYAPPLDGVPSKRIPDPLQDTINASQLCHHWRIATLSAPELWKLFIDGYHPCRSWTKLLLERSVPLGVELLKTRHQPDYYLSPEYISRPLQNQLNKRLIGYRVRLPSGHDWSSAWPNMPQSWPRLKYLCLLFHLYISWDTERPPESAGCRKLPEQFPGAATPILQRLQLDYCWMPEWSNIKYFAGTLTSLSVKFPPRPVAPTLNTWINIIRALPHINNIQFSGAFSLPPSPSSSYTPMKHTLDVETFAIDDSPAMCAHFFDHISLSSKCRFLTLKCFSPLFHEDDSNLKRTFKHIKQKLFDQIVIISSPNFFTWRAIRSVYPEITVSGFSSPSTLESFPRTSDSDLSGYFHVGFRHHYHIDKAETGTWVSSEFKPISNVLYDLLSTTINTTNHLLIDFRLFHRRDDKERLLPLLSQCHKIWGLSYMSLDLWRKLYPVLTHTNDLEAQSTLLPSLRAICFNDNPHPLLEIIETRHGRTFLDDLVHFCEHRQRLGVPIQKISFDDYFRRREKLDEDIIRSRLESLGILVEIIHYKDSQDEGWW